MNITVDTHELLPMRSRVEGHHITKKAYVDTIEDGEFYPPEGASTFWDDSTNKLYVIGGEIILI